MRVSLLVRGLSVALLLAVCVQGPALALHSPYADPGAYPAGTIKAYAGDGTEIDVSYYDRSGDAEYPQLVGDSGSSSVSWPGGAGGPVPTSFANPPDSSCSPHEPWPYRTMPEFQDKCWDILFNPYV
jgi:hypothetical protein